MNEQIDRLENQADEAMKEPDAAEITRNILLDTIERLESLRGKE